MEKKRSVGVITLAIIMLIYSMLCLIIYKGTFICYLNPVLFCQYLFIELGTYSHGIDSVTFLVAGCFILIMKDWARSLAVISSCILLLGRLPAAIHGIFHPAVFIYHNFFVTHPTFFGIKKDNYNLFSIVCSYGIAYIPIILYVILIIFFTRPKVKEQFK